MRVWRLIAVFSIEQPEDAYDDHIRGGGPAAEHCYTRGLAMRYLTSGDRSARDACLALSDWMSRTHEGPFTLFGCVLRALKLHYPALLKFKRGESAGYYLLPLTRGTGNYIRALLDAYLVTGEHAYLDRICGVVARSAHPLDDIDRRNMGDVERSWSYTIYLTALGEYLHVKAGLSEFDAAFYYARDVLVHYARWMLDWESPYLSQPERLEFPNHTWTAQDLRKAVVLYYAHRFNGDNDPAYLAQSRVYLNAVIDTLEAEPTRVYTRIRAILLQNLDMCESHSRERDKPAAGNTAKWI